MDISELGIPELSGGIDAIQFDCYLDDLRYACLVARLPGADTLHVALRSSVPQPEQKAPAFVRYQSTEAMRGHVLSICDPTLFLSPTIRIGAFVGTAAQDPIPNVILLAESVAEKLGVDRSRIVYWGSSGSGLGAAMAAIHSGNGRAVLVNAMLDVADFRTSASAAPVASIFNGGDLDKMFADYPERMSVAVALAEAHARGEAPKLLLVQNIRDERFHTRQFLPFCERFDIPAGGGFSSDGTLKTFVYAGDHGHGLEPPEVLEQIVGEGFPIQPAEPAIVLGTTNRFCATADRLWMQDVSGLGRAERTHRWTIGPNSGLSFTLPAECPPDLTLRLEARGCVTDTAPTVTADILVGDTHVGLLHDDVNDAERAAPVFVRLPAGAVGPNRRVRLSLRIRDARSPKALGLNDDQRQLGFNLIALTVDAHHADAAEPSASPDG